AIDAARLPATKCHTTASLRDYPNQTSQHVPRCICFDSVLLGNAV
ncbi:uncharacterized protein METZ01_LOCUS479374, partial [marine metagenome]